MEIGEEHHRGTGGVWLKPQSGFLVFESWFQLELEADWKLPRRDFPFKASSGCKQATCRVPNEDI